LNKPDVYKFRIDSFTPSTIPMIRLATYMLELARLMGNDTSVHFREIQRGSAVIVSEVESVAVPKVRGRLTRVEGAASNWRENDETSDPFWKLNSMLAADNAVGNLRRGTATILKFPGREAERVKIGPVTQPTSLIGQLVRVGGRDASAHALIQDAEGRGWRIIMTREQARALARYLYGDVMRFTGSGRWFRTEGGFWELDELRLQSWDEVTNETLRESVDSLRLLSSDWQKTLDPMVALERIRHGGESGAH
jgi:hypothetical protein